jgi:hypothetical protein
MEPHRKGSLNSVLGVRATGRDLTTDGYPHGAAGWHPLPGELGYPTAESQGRGSSGWTLVATLLI